MTKPESMWQYGFGQRTSSGRCARTSQVSVTVLPELIAALEGDAAAVRALRFTSNPLYREYSSPKLLPQVVRLLTWPNSAGVMSYRPGDDVAAAAGQPRIRRRGDAEAVVARRRRQQVVGDGVVQCR